MTKPDQHDDNKAAHHDHHHKHAHKPTGQEVVERIKTLPQFRYDATAPRPSYLKLTLAIMAAHVATFPLVYHKTREQLGLGTVREAHQKFGFVGHFRGVTPFLYGAALRGGVQAALVSGSPNDPKKTTFWKYATLFTPVALTLLVGPPVENLQTLHINDQISANRQFGSVGSIMKNGLQTEGIKSLYRGAIPQTISVAIFYGSSFFFLKQRSTGDTFSDYAKALLPLNIVASILANPFEVVKTRLQGTEGRTYESFSQTWAKDGVKSLFIKGLLPFTARNVAFGFLVSYFLSHH